EGGGRGWLCRAPNPRSAARAGIFRFRGGGIRRLPVILVETAVAGRAFDREEGRRPVHRAAAMRHVARGMDGDGRSDDAVFVAEDEMQLALEDERELLFIGMLMQRRAFAFRLGHDGSLHEFPDDRMDVDG